MIILPDFPTTEQILLEQNYRSTASILKASLAIVAEGKHTPSSNPSPNLKYSQSSFRQDKSRIQKALHTSHPGGPVPVLRSFHTENEEAKFIAIEIKRLVAHMGGTYTKRIFFKLYYTACIVPDSIRLYVQVRFNGEILPCYVG